MYEAAVLYSAAHSLCFWLLSKLLITAGKPSSTRRLQSGLFAGEMLVAVAQGVQQQPRGHHMLASQCLQHSTVKTAWAVAGGSRRAAEGWNSACNPTDFCQWTLYRHEHWNRRSKVVMCSKPLLFVYVAYMGTNQRRLIGLNHASTLVSGTSICAPQLHPESVGHIRHQRPAQITNFGIVISTWF